MKKLLFLLLFSFSLASAQSNEPFIDPALTNAFESIVKRAETHQKDYRTLLQANGLVAIVVVDSLPKGKIGRCIKTGNSFTVEIPKLSLKDAVSLEWTLAHELGHGLGLEPVIEYLPDGATRAWSTEIMAEDGVIDPTHIVYQIMNSEQYSPGIWANYFNQLQP